MSFDSDPVICPICLRLIIIIVVVVVVIIIIIIIIIVISRDVLTQDFEFIRCSCGLSINTAVSF